MKSMTGVQMIETKLEDGVQQFSAQEVAHLLNEIRIQKAITQKVKRDK